MADWRKFLEQLHPEKFEGVQVVIVMPGGVVNMANNYGFISYGSNYGNVQIFNQLAGLENSNEGRDIGAALKTLLSAIDRSDKLSAEQKQELLENIGSLIEQAGAEKPRRRLGVVRSAWGFIRDNVGPAKDLLEAAETVQKLIGPFFGINA